MTEDKNYFKPDCKYANECTSKGELCKSCERNNKKDFYKPKIAPFPQPYTIPIPTTFPSPLPKGWEITCKQQ